MSHANNRLLTDSLQKSDTSISGYWQAGDARPIAHCARPSDVLLSHRVISRGVA